MGNWRRPDKEDWIIILSAGLIILVLMSLPFFVNGDTYDFDSDPEYIVIASIDLHFTKQEYHDRVLAQIEEGGFRSVCILHLLTLSSAAVETSENNKRIYSVLLQECAIAAEGAFTTTGE